MARKPRDYAAEYRRRIEKAKREGRSLQSGRGRHPREKEARIYRPGRVARHIFGPPKFKPPRGPTYRRYRTKGADNAFGYVLPFVTERDQRRVYRFIEAIVPSLRDNWSYRFGGIARQGGSPREHGRKGNVEAGDYVTTEHIQLYDVARFDAKLIEFAPKFVEIVAVHFDYAK